MTEIILDARAFIAFDNRCRAEAIAYAAWCAGIPIESVSIAKDGFGNIMAAAAENSRFSTMAAIIDVFPRSPAVQHSAHVIGDTIHGQQRRQRVLETAGL